MRSEVVDDENRVVIGSIGWYGHIWRMHVFHWCHSPLDEKWEELDTVYNAAEGVEDWMPLALAISVVPTKHYLVHPREPSEDCFVSATGAST